MSCRGLRLAVLVSAVLLLSTLGVGWLMSFLGDMPLATPYVGLVALLAALAILTGVFLLSLLPGTNQRLSECLH